MTQYKHTFNSGLVPHSCFKCQHLLFCILCMCTTLWQMLHLCYVENKLTNLHNNPWMLNYHNMITTSNTRKLTTVLEVLDIFFMELEDELPLKRSHSEKVNYLRTVIKSTVVRDCEALIQRKCMVNTKNCFKIKRRQVKKKLTIR